VIPDPVTLDLARRTPYPYRTVHETLALLADAGVDHDRAVELVEDAARARVNPTALARSYLSWAGPRLEDAQIETARWWDLTIWEGLQALGRLIWGRR
jgi:hypothetical protein